MIGSELNTILKNSRFVGIVEDNLDPDRKQRIKVRIPFLHGDSNQIPTNALPWCQAKRGLNGMSFEIPEKGKIVYVTFPNQNFYYPEYEAAIHLNINLQKKIEEYSGQDYADFIALLYNWNTQIWVENEKGLNIIHKYNGINIKKDNLTLLLKDNQSELYLGDETGNQELVLGTNFMQWMDTLVQTLLNAYIGNLGAPAVANPALINVINQYFAQRTTFLSQHIYAVDNNQIKSKDFPVDNRIGDQIKTSVKSKDLNIETRKIEWKPKPIVEEKGIEQINNYVAPPTDGSNDGTSATEGNKPEPVIGDNAKEVDRMIRYLKSQNYEVYEKPYQLNIVGVRNKIKDGGQITNKFDDWCWVFYKTDSGQWDLRKYNITTTPGFKPNSNVLPLGPGNNGVAMLVYGQFRNRFKLGYHQKRTGKPGGKINEKTGQLAPEHRALCFATTAHIRQAPNGQQYLIPGRGTVETQAIGINMHHASEIGTSPSVFNWSEGCQVFANKQQHDEFIGLCDQHVQKTNIGTFTYTLIPQREFEIFK